MEVRINPKIHMETQKMAVKAIISKKKLLVASQYLTLNYAVEP